MAQHHRETLNVDLSIIIVNYNVREFLDSALVSISKAAAGIGHEIIVVDNASDDGSVDLVRTKFPEVCLIASEANLGFARANNLALKRARGEFILLINPDTIVQENTFRVMIEFLDAHPDAGMAGCKILNPDGTLQLACRRSFPTPLASFSKITGLSTLFPNSRIFSRYNLTYLDPDRSYDLDAISGSFMMIRRKAYEAVGGFDEEFFMYGEDLDLCYRIKKAGWKIYYVHSTQIIHYKGESTKRSDLDEIKIFYQAMHLYVRKHAGNSAFVQTFLRTGVALRSIVAMAWKLARSGFVPAIDILLIDLSQFLGEFLWMGGLGRYPRYAYPVVYIVPALIVVVTMSFFGVYTERRHGVSRTAGGVIVGFTVISALVFFLKDYGFSRGATVLSFAASLFLLTGWRLAARSISRGGGRILFGRRTLIVGTSAPAQELLKKIRMRAEDEYDVVGFIDMNRQRLGETILGVGIIGSIDNIGRVIRERKITDVIFSTDSLAYGDILAVIGRSSERSVNFRLVPTNLEVIIGKTHIDHLDDIPLVEIDYNINKIGNRFMKRAFDLALSIPLLISMYPLVYLKRSAFSGAPSAFSAAILDLPRVVAGRYSFVGRSRLPAQHGQRGGGEGTFLGKVGLTGIVQINSHDAMAPGEIERYDLYYAKNQSLALDIEILLKSIFYRTKEHGNGKSGPGV